MSTNLTDEHDPDNMFKDTRMSFGDHIEDLRSHLLRALKGFAIGMVFGFWPLGPYVLELINSPVDQELSKYEERKLERDIAKNREKLRQQGILAQPKVNEIFVDRQQLMEDLGLKPKRQVVEEEKIATELQPMIRWVAGFQRNLDGLYLPPEDLLVKGDYIRVQTVIPDSLKVLEDSQRAALKLRPRRVTTLGITEMFFVYMKISFFTGLVLSSPWVFYHLWMFIAAGLYPNEKKLVNYYLPFSVVLFIGGVLLCEFFAMAQAVKAMLAFNEWLDTDADIRLSEWLGFAIMMPVVFGLAFQTPLVMMFLHKVGIVTVELLRNHRRIAWFALVIVAALLAPSPDPQSLLLLWVPMVALYELGILLCVWQGEKSVLFDFGSEEEEKSGELVEV